MLCQDKRARFWCGTEKRGVVQSVSVVEPATFDVVSTAYLMMMIQCSTMEVMRKERVEVGDY